MGEEWRRKPREGWVRTLLRSPGAELGLALACLTFWDMWQRPPDVSSVRSSWLCWVQGSAPSSGLGTCRMEELMGTSGRPGRMLICSVSLASGPFVGGRVQEWGGCPREPCALDDQRGL